MKAPLENFRLRSSWLSPGFSFTSGTSLGAQTLKKTGCLSSSRYGALRPRRTSSLFDVKNWKFVSMDATAGVSSTYCAPRRWKIVSRPCGRAAPPAPRGATAAVGGVMAPAGPEWPTIASMIESDSPALFSVTSAWVLVSNFDCVLRIFARMTASDRPAFFIAITESLLSTSCAPTDVTTSSRTHTVSSRATVFMVPHRIVRKAIAVKAGLPGEATAGSDARAEASGRTHGGGFAHVRGGMHQRDNAEDAGAGATGHALHDGLRAGA